MAIERVKEYLKAFGRDKDILELPESSATVELAAVAVGTEPEKIAKSLTFMVDEQPVMIICAGDAKINNSKYKGYFHKKAKMLTREEENEI